jgi:hypothetical protein
LVGGKAWNGIVIQIPNIESISICLPSTETIPTDAEQIAANISRVLRNMKKGIEFRVEMTPLNIVLVAINPHKTG